jgi:tRNA dimethylallyltransferase
LALLAAEAIGAEIINADSLAFYKGLDIGAAKPTLAERALAPHHLFDVVEPNEPFDAAAYLRLARPLIVSLNAAGRAPLVVGGTGLYLRSLTKGLFEGPGARPEIRAELKALAQKGQDIYALLVQEDPKAAALLNPHDYVRVERALEVKRATGRSLVDFRESHNLSDRPFKALTLIVDRPTTFLDQDLRRRTEGMFEGGLIEETAALLAQGYGPELKPLRAIGYREAVAYLGGQMTLAAAKEAVYLRSRRLAKRQRTWFRGQTPEGIWVQPNASLIIEIAKRFWRGEESLV